jgi:hypothetical protein
MNICIFWDITSCCSVRYSGGEYRLHRKGASTLLVLVLAKVVTVHIETAAEIRCVLLQAWRARVMWTRLKDTRHLNEHNRMRSLKSTRLSLLDVGFLLDSLFDS